MSTGDQDAVAAFLTQALSGTGQVETVTTHISQLFLAGSRVFKLKRAVRFPYLDFSTPERRLAACEAEVVLNRRTAPALYLGARRITRGPDGGLAFDGTGNLVDAVVEMRRFPQADLFDTLACEGRLGPDHIADLAQVIAAFHAGAEIHRDKGGAAALTALVDLNAAALLATGLASTGAVATLTARFRAVLARHAARRPPRRRQGPPLPRRPHLAQHLPVRGQADAVRLHRVQRDHRDDRHPVRPRLRPHGPLAPVALRPRQPPAQSLPRWGGRDRRSRIAAGPDGAARGDPRPRHGGSSGGRNRRGRRRQDRRGARVSRPRGRPADRQAGGPPGGRRLQRFRQVERRGGGGPLDRRGPGRPDPVERSDPQAPARGRRPDAAPGGGLCPDRVAARLRDPAAGRRAGPGRGPLRRRRCGLRPTDGAGADRGPRPRPGPGSAASGWRPRPHCSRAASTAAPATLRMPPRRSWRPRSRGVAAPSRGTSSAPISPWTRCARRSCRSCGASA